MGTYEVNVAMDAEKGVPAPTMSSLEAGAECDSLAPSQFSVPVATDPHH